MRNAVRELTKTQVTEQTRNGDTVMRHIYKVFLIAGEFLYNITLNNIADFDVVETLYRAAALKAVVDFLYIVLEALELLDVAFYDEHVVAVDAELAAADNLTIEHIATGNVAHACDFEYLADFALAHVDLLILGREHALERRLHVVEEVVYYAVGADIYLAALGQRLGL